MAIHTYTHTYINLVKYIFGCAGRSPRFAPFGRWARVWLGIDVPLHAAFAIGSTQQAAER